MAKEIFELKRIVLSLQRQIDDINKQTLQIEMTEFNKINKRIDRMAINYKILDSDKFALKTELKEVSHKLRKRIYDVERSNTTD